MRRGSLLITTVFMIMLQWMAGFVNCQCDSNPNLCSDMSCPTQAGGCYCNPACGPPSKLCCDYVAVCRQRSCSYYNCNSSACCQIQCPANLMVNNSPLLCSAVVSFNVTEIHGIPSICSPSVMGGYSSGSSFPVGTTNLTYSDSQTSCSFSVTVKDNEKPAIQCASGGNSLVSNIVPNSTENGGVGVAIPKIATITRGTTDNCNHQNLPYTSVPSTFSCFQIVSSPISTVISATDSSGNVANCTVEIQVTDTSGECSVAITSGPSAQQLNEGQSLSGANLGSVLFSGPFPPYDAVINWGTSKQTIVNVVSGFTMPDSPVYSAGMTSLIAQIVISNNASASSQGSQVWNFTVTVNNVAPTWIPTLPASTLIKEGSTVALNLFGTYQFFDPGYSNDALYSVSVDWTGSGQFSALSFSTPLSSNKSFAIPISSPIYPQPESKTLVLRIADRFGAFSDQQTKVIVTNVAPGNLIFFPLNTFVEARTFAPSGYFGMISFQDPGGNYDAPYSLYINWDLGDGLQLISSGQVIPNVQFPVPQSPIFPINSKLSITVTVVDGLGASGSLEFSISVGQSIPKILSSPLNVNISEGSFAASAILGPILFSDTYVTPLNVLVYWHGIYDVPVIIQQVQGVQFFLPHSPVFPDGPMSYNAVMSISSPEGGGTSFSGFEITITNVVPLVTIPKMATVVQGQQANISLNFFDPAGGLDVPYDVAVDWMGTGHFVHQTLRSYPTETSSLPQSPFFYFPGTYQASVVLTDKDLGSSILQTCSISVTNDVPIFTIYPETLNVVQGHSVENQWLQWNDSGLFDVFTISVDWFGDGTFVQQISSLMSQRSVVLPQSPVYNSIGQLTVTISITDNYGGSSSIGTEVNVIPITNSIIFQQPKFLLQVNEGETISGQYIYFYGPLQLSFSAIVRWPTEFVGTEATVQQLTQRMPMFRVVFPQSPVFLDGPARLSVFVTVTSSAGFSATLEGTVQVNAVPPSLINFNPPSNKVGSGPLDLGSINFFDPGLQDVFTASIYWGDGSPMQQGEVEKTGGSLEGSIRFPSHTYCDNATDLVQISITEGSGIEFLTVTFSLSGDCLGGKCCAAPPGQCLVAVCPNAARGCSYIFATEKACDDGDQCTINDRCDQSGFCRGQAPPRGFPCDDGDLCTISDICTPSGVCLGVRRLCDDGDPCTVDYCDQSSGLCDSQADPSACPSLLFPTTSLSQGNLGSPSIRPLPAVLQLENHSPLPLIHSQPTVLENMSAVASWTRSRFILLFLSLLVALFQ